MATQEQFCEHCGAANSSEARFCQYCSTPLPFRHTTGDLPEQTLLAGRYQLVSRIGQGGMGAVYKATDTRFNNRTIAIKEMSRLGLTQTQIQEAEGAFERESQLLAELLHPNLPRIYDHFNEEERSYLVMDFIEGQTIDEYLEKIGGGPVPLEQVLLWGEQLCDVLSYLHTHQPPIIFRDLKPQNVMISENGHLYLIDFGIARIFKPGQSHDTVAFGSPGFAAPEQYGKAQSTPRSDIYSLGALMHCLLTAVDPSEQPFFFQRASMLNADVPFEMDELLQHMLEMTADKRPENVQEVDKALRHIDQQRISGTLNTLSQTRPHSIVPPLTPGRLNNQFLQEAYNLYSQRRLKEALVMYDRALKDDAQNAIAWQGRGLTLALTGQHREALASFDQALKIDPNLLTSLNGKGTALNMLHRNQEALEVFDRAILLEQDNAIAWNGKGAVLSALRQPENALKAFETALHFDRYMAQGWSNKGLVLRQLRRYDEALRSFDQALSLDRDAISSWNGKGLVLSEQGRYKEATQAYEEVLKRDPKYAPALCGLGDILCNQRKFRAAKDLYDQAIANDRRFARAWERRALALTEIGNLTDALASYDEALRLEPRSSAAWNGKAGVLFQLERYQQALDAYTNALQCNNNIPQAWNGKGNAYYFLGNYQQALEAYERALRLNPRMASAQHNKSLVLKHLQRYEEALDAANEAIRLAPTDPDNWRRKAESLKKLHRRREARAAEAEIMRLRGSA